MPEVKIVSAPSFKVYGKKTWIGGTDNELFGRFWAESRENGLVSRLQALARPLSESVTGSAVVGVSRVEKDPNNREFFFYIGAEYESGDTDGLESFEVEAGDWAVFWGHGENNAMALLNCEMYAFMTWLPSSGYAHDKRPEMETYPPCDAGDGYAEFWIPVCKK